MAYRAPVPLRLFQYAMWAIMVFVAIWFFVLPLIIPATSPQQGPAAPPEPAIAPARMP